MELVLEQQGSCRAEVKVRVRVRVVRVRIRVRARVRVRGWGLLPTNSHSMFYSRVGQIEGGRRNQRYVIHTTLSGIR